VLNRSDSSARAISTHDARPPLHDLAAIADAVRKLRDTVEAVSREWLEALREKASA